MIIRNLGLQTYQVVWDEMKQFTLSRETKTPDECWLLEHYPVYTQGQAGKPEHLLNPANIPVVQSDRGGQITYHGPGQLVAYVLIDLKRRHIGIRTLVCKLEALLITLLGNYQLQAVTRCGAPGVYLNEKKIASIGLRVKNGYTYHGIALNVNMDLKPFKGINPCGFSQLEMTQINDYIPGIELAEVQQKLGTLFLEQFKTD
ncbi:Legionella secretion system protein X [Legionella birminghamensis]|uniref:Octanoyltransferase n=1 Tax=Legionella birminghamensis TaxID=28083 RepID=A0A378IAM6_9GAMM|nr:lipoyl(octanoyl) transferase LipB [Legionella birminghamensis]KTC75229.1 Legionella secretion system protein X [Legionella birminghamensis]STX31820.1 Legionella secretion system protein X [Legionella birminghamensis]